MFLLMLQLGSLNTPEQDSFAQCWVRTEQQEDTIPIATEALREKGWRIAEVKEITTTQLSDYFSPCLSQQAFLQAEQQGFACRIQWEELHAEASLT